MSISIFEYYLFSKAKKNDYRCEIYEKENATNGIRTLTILKPQKGKNRCRW